MSTERKTSATLALLLYVDFEFLTRKKHWKCILNVPFCSWIKRDQLDVTYFFISFLMLNVFWMLVHPSSGACDLFVELFHGLYCSGSMRVGVTNQSNTTHEITRQISLVLPRMDVLTSETCWALNNEIKKASDIKLVSLYSTIKIIQDYACSNKHKCLIMFYTTDYERFRHIVATDSSLYTVDVRDH